MGGYAKKTPVMLQPLEEYEQRIVPLKRPFPAQALSI
jgi:hypothetical protein